MIPLRCHVAAAAMLALSSHWAIAQEAQQVTIVGRSELPAPDVAGFGARTPLARTPLSALVVGELALVDNGQRNLAELTRLDASISDAYNAEGYWSFLSIRGFTLDNRSNYRRDGLPINAETSLPLWNKESVEVLKGASGIQAGTSAPGGLVNLVVKRPDGALRSARVEARQGGGSSLAMDIAERFGTEGQFGVRVNAAYEDLDPQTYNARGHRSLAAVAADMRLGASTLLEAEFEASHQTQPSAPGFSLLGNQLPSAETTNPRTNLNNQAWSLPVVLDGRTASLRLTQALGSQWRGRVHAMTQRLDSDDRIAFPYGCSAEGNYDRYCSDGSLDLYDFRSDGEKRRSDALDLSLEGRFDTGAVRHELTTGLLATRFEAILPPQAFNYAGTGQADGSAAVPAAPEPVFDVADRKERSTELYLRDRIQLAPQWSLWAGVRHTRLERDELAQQSFTSPWLALAWQASAATLLYANWGKGIESEVAPNLPMYSNAARALPALESRQLEAGVKHVAESWTAALAIFSIQRPQSGDFGACDGSDGSCTRAIDGEAHHRGVEAQYGAQLGAWRLQASAMLLDASRSGAADTSLNGLEPVNVPSHSLRLQAGYSITEGTELVANLSQEGARAALPDNSVRVPTWTRLDLGLKLQLRVAGAHVTWRAGIDNVTDARDWKEAPYQFGHAYLFPQAPRSARISLQVGL